MNARLHGCCLVVALVLVGCSKSTDPNRPKTVPVTGTVTYKGQPVEGALVTLSTTAAGGRGASGKTDAAGNITLTTFEAGDGALPGLYDVAIAKTTIEGAPTEAESQAYVAKGQQPPLGTVKEHLPAKYKDEKTSGLRADVKEGVVLKFELTD
jgi:hypothetical protein